MSWLTVIIACFAFSTIYINLSVSPWLALIYTSATGIVLGLWRTDIIIEEEKPFIWRISFVKNRCKKCDVDMVEGKALENTLYGIPDFIGDDTVCTVSMTGPPIMISVWKCPKCGYSVT